MPPWLAEHGYGDFANDRSLSEEQLEILQRWIAEGAVEGDPESGPRAPEFKGGWELGSPDLVVSMREAYRLKAAAPDIYYNVPIPVGVAERRFVRAMEFHPGNSRIVHHASIYFDPTGESRRTAARGNQQGFEAMQPPESASTVAGQMLGWEPGKRPEKYPPGQAWPLEKGSDLLLQLHLHSTGKSEEVKSEVGFYFTDQAPTNTPFLLRIPEWRIDIPAGASNYVVENSFTLPVDVEALRVSPHAHYIARDMQGFAILPNGTKQWLLWIRDWNFNWQGDYQYKRPIFLPKGTKVAMRFTYDNSAENPRNPNSPPKRVRYGPQTTDEMAQLALQVMPRNPGDRQLLAAELLKKMTLDAISYNESLLAENPNDAKAHAKIGQALLPLGRYQEALKHLNAANRLDPTNDKVHYDLGTLLTAFGQLENAEREFKEAIRLNPNDYQAHGNLGAVYARMNESEKAERELSEAVRLNPDDAVAKRALEQLLSVPKK